MPESYSWRPATATPGQYPYPINLGSTPQLAVLLDTLKPTYGPGLPSICAAAVGALYEALRPMLAEADGVDAQVEALAALMWCGRGEVVRLALFWLAVKSVDAGKAGEGEQSC